MKLEFLKRTYFAQFGTDICFFSENSCYFVDKEFEILRVAGLPAGNFDFTLSPGCENPYRYKTFEFKDAAYGEVGGWLCKFQPDYVCKVAEIPYYQRLDGCEAEHRICTFGGRIIAYNGRSFYIFDEMAQQFNYFYSPELRFHAIFGHDKAVAVSKNGISKFSICDKIVDFQVPESFNIYHINSELVYFEQNPFVYIFDIDRLVLYQGKFSLDNYLLDVQLNGQGVFIEQLEKTTKISVKKLLSSCESLRQNLSIVIHTESAANADPVARNDETISFRQIDEEGSQPANGLQQPVQANEELQAGKKMGRPQTAMNAKVQLTVFGQIRRRGRPPTKLKEDRIAIISAGRRNRKQYLQSETPHLQ